MKSIVSLPQFKDTKRELLLDYKYYEQEAVDLSARIPKAALRLKDPNWLAGKDAGTIMLMTHGRTEYSLDLLTLNYSAGLDLAALRAEFIPMLSYFEEYAKFVRGYNETPEGKSVKAPCIALRDAEFQKANRLVCFAILLGWENLLNRVMPLLDYNNSVHDGMLERMATNFVEGRGTPPDECTRHLPYFKTLKIFAADSAQRSQLMKEYLDEWYAASRREPYYDSHKKGSNFLGYWSWESAAITFILDIDDSSYADAKFYPKDLVDFARSAKQDYAPAGIAAASPNEVRAKAGDPCPKSGSWTSLTVPSQTVQYELGEVMRDVQSPYGHTVWAHFL